MSAAIPDECLLDELERIRSLLMELLESELFSGVVMIRLDGRTLIEHASGLANRATRQPIRIDTRFATASVSKMFTATCIARLVDAGLCRFEQPLIEAAPSLRQHFGEQITLANLMSHRSGLGDYIDDDAELPFAGMDVAQLDCPRAFLPHVLGVRRHKPGEFSYSSAGYVLLGIAIEELTGQPFPGAVAHWIVEPTGLRSTGFPEMDVPAAVDFAVGYLPDGRSNVGHLPRKGGADGGIVTTATDLLRFFECMRAGGFISDAVREFLWEPCGQISEISSYGHGFYLTKIGREVWPGHTGSDPGVSARVAFSPTDDSSIIVLCNSEGMAFRVFRLASCYMNSCTEQPPRNSHYDAASSAS